MNTKDDQSTIRTHAVVIVFACLMSALGALPFGFIGAMSTGWKGESDTVVLIAAVKWAITGAALGASFVGLIALIVGGKLSRHFSYPFAICLCGFPGPICVFLRDLHGIRTSFEEIWFVAVVLGAVGGIVLARCIRGYRRWSRVGSVIGAGAMLLIGGFLMHMLLGRPIVGDVMPWIFLIGMLSITVCGGALGAMIGAIGDRPTG